MTASSTPVSARTDVVAGQLVSERQSREDIVAAVQHKTHAYQQVAWHWQRVMGQSPTRSTARQLQDSSPRVAEKSLRFWRRQATKAHKQAQHPPHLADWLCIQSGIKGGRWSPSLTYLGGGYHVSGHGEASWTDAGAPYWGGLQMNLQFQKQYGRWLYISKGTANHWNAYEQMWVADRAYSSGRGFYPWPNTAHACGLI